MSAFTRVCDALWQPSRRMAAGTVNNPGHGSRRAAVAALLTKRPEF